MRLILKAFHDSEDAVVYIFLGMGRNQFFFDVNKRIAILMIKNGLLLSEGCTLLDHTELRL